MTREVSPRRPRGRPQGSGIDDSQALAKAADLLAQHNAMKPTTAFKRSIKGIDGSHLRRLQVKWKLSGQEYLAAARQRLQQRQARAAMPSSLPAGIPPYPASDAVKNLEIILGRQNAWLDIHKKLNDATNPLAKMLKTFDSFKHMAESPLEKTMRRLMESENRMRDLIDPPYLRHMRQHFDATRQHIDILNLIHPYRKGSQSTA